MKVLNLEPIASFFYMDLVLARDLVLRPEMNDVWLEVVLNLNILHRSYLQLLEWEIDDRRILFNEEVVVCESLHMQDQKLRERLDVVLFALRHLVPIEFLENLVNWDLSNNWVLLRLTFVFENRNHWDI